MKPPYRTALRIYLFACIGIGVFLQAGKPHPDYYLGGFYGLVGSWIGPGIAAKLLADLFKVGELNVLAVLGISAAFWLVFFKAAKPGSQSRTSSRQPRGAGLVVDASGYDVLPNLPPGLSYYSKPQTITRTRTYEIEGD